MIIKQLSILNYKNIRQAELSFVPKLNCFVGENGAGKSNILDALYYLSNCKSYRNSIDTQNISHNEDFFVLQGEYVEGEREEHIYCGFKRRQKKQFKRNKKEYERLSQHIGVLPLVLVSPADQYLILEGSQERRRFIDSIISQYDREYLHALICYNTALVQRNSLLKQDCRDTTLYEIWEEQLHSNGSFIFEQRKAFLEKFVPVFRYYYQFLSQGNEDVSISYLSQLTEEPLLAQLQKARQRDTILGHTSKGIHRDDLEMLLGTYPVKRVGSQGQNKTYLLALKLAQFRFLQQTSGMMPLLLLDDIFDKLDQHRVKQIVQLVSTEDFGQIFITDTDRGHLNTIITQLQRDAQILTVDKGEIFS